MLTDKQQRHIKKTFISCVDQLVAQFSMEDSETLLIPKLIELVLPLRLYRFFIPKTSVELAQAIFQDVVLREFLLELTDLLSIQLTTEVPYLDQQINSIATSVLRVHNKEYINVLIPTPIHNELEVSDELHITELLRENMWLISVFLLKLHLTETASFREAVAIISRPFE